MKKELDLDQIARLAGLGLSEDQIARSMGISRTTLWRRKRDTDEVRQAIEDGKASAIQQVTNRLFEKALEGDNTAMIFWLKNRAGWADVQKHEVTNKPAEECTIDELADRLKRRAGVSPTSRSH